MKIKSNKGFALADTIIAIFIFTIFTGIIISISYNIVLTSNFVKRNGQATNYIVDVFEYAKTLEFANIDSENLALYVNSKNENITATNENFSEDSEKLNSYTMFISLDENAIEEEKRQFIKKIDITVMYKLGGKTKNVSMSTLINK